MNKVYLFFCQIRRLLARFIETNTAGQETFKEGSETHTAESPAMDKIVLPHRSPIYEETLESALNSIINETVLTTYGVIPLKHAIDSGDLEIWSAGFKTLNEISQRLIPLLTRDARFPGTKNFFLRTNGGGSYGFYPHQAAEVLVQRTMYSENPDEAIQWLLRVLNARDATGCVIEALWGVSVNQEIQLTENVSLLPISAIKDSPLKTLLSGQRNAMPQNISHTSLTMDFPESVLVAKLALNNVVFTASDKDDHQTLNRQSGDHIDELLKDITLVLSIIGPRVTISAAVWFEFDDPDLHFASMNLGTWLARNIEVMPSWSPNDSLPFDAAKAKELVTRFFALPLELKMKIRVALHRLNIAQRRNGGGDKAIDLCIALESLLGGNEANEVTHKVTTRTARLLAGSDEQRMRNRDIVNATYGYRSKMVHAGIEPTGKKLIAGVNTTSGEIIEATVGICVEVITIIIRMGQVPDWKQFDIQAGV